VRFYGTLNIEIKATGTKKGKELIVATIADVK
jgi:hypothetical protein